ncbi:MAG: hypothetical protein QGH37_06030 [Candidatus Poribacteria bacterium]|nr:hypothetical protein [Candidatus Poribacteria bacterium]
MLAELYDLVPRHSGRCNLKFYIDLCRQTGGKVLELGCGTGRVLTPIAVALHRNRRTGSVTTRAGEVQSESVFLARGDSLSCAAR